MNRLAIVTGLVVMVAVVGLCAAPSVAATLYWDGTDSTADADGGAGTWNTTTTNTNWDTASTGGTDTYFTNGDNVVFGGTAGTVTVANGVSAGSMQFDTAGYTLTSAAGATFTFTSISGSTATLGGGQSGSARYFILNNAADVTWSGTIGASTASSTRTHFTKDGVGTFTFQGALGGSTTTINAGVLKLSAATTGSSPITLTGSTRIDLNGCNLTARTLNSSSSTTRVISATGTPTLTIGAGTSIFEGKVEDGIKIVMGGLSGSETSLLRLTNTANNFSGGIDLSSGGGNGPTLEIANVLALSSGTIKIAGKATIQSADATNHTITNPFAIGNTSGDMTFGKTSVNTGTLTFTNTTNVAMGLATCNFVTNVDTSFAFGLTGSGKALQKSGDATLTLKGASTYNGGTTVSAGTLLVNNISGSGTGTAAVNVNGGTLGGTGSISGAVTVASGAFLAPGASTGSLTVGSATIDGTLKIELDDAGTPKVDVLNVTGALNITNATVDFDVTGSPGQTAYVFATYGSLTGTAFANEVDRPAGYKIEYKYLGGNQIALVIPEPATLGVLVLGGVGMLLRRRRV